MTPSTLHLPSQALAYLSGMQAQISHTTGTPATPEDALLRILGDHGALATVAAHQGLTVTAMCAALALGDITVTSPANASGAQQ